MFVVVVMMFGIKTALMTFQRIVMEIFGEYISVFMQVFLDNFIVYSCTEEHLDHLWMCLEKCRRSQLSLNLAKCVFKVTSGTLLRLIVNKDKTIVDHSKMKMQILEWMHFQDGMMKIYSKIFTTIFRSFSLHMCDFEKDATQCILSGRE